MNNPKKSIDITDDEEQRADGGPRPAGVLKNFYDSYGWTIDEATGLLKGVSYFQDMDPVATKYRHDHEMRFKPVYGDGGKFFLDAGCGGDPRPALSENFDVHLCLDISIVGLKAARDQLGESGAYILADLSRLPFKDGAFDGVLASHCLYHVEKDQQKIVLDELHRVTATDKSLLVFYSSRNNLISVLHRVSNLGTIAVNVILNRIGFHLGHSPPYLTRNSKSSDTSVDSDVPDLYSFAHNPVRLVRGFDSADVSCLMTFTIYDTGVLRKLQLLKPAIRIFDYMERVFPHAMRYVGKFTCIRIQKQSGPE